ncbi:precorrin-3B synthase, partial [Mangrovicoccus sp. HB182678]|nr:precorrin-3B synthase [Mangrovicoccus algicola]
PAHPPPGPGPVAGGCLAGFAFGTVPAATLAALARAGRLRLTPWRMLFLEGAASLPDLPGLIGDAADPMLRVHACAGAPFCLQAHRPTRALARRLAPLLPEGAVLHVSGCDKHCARPPRADVTLTATPEGYMPCDPARLPAAWLPLIAETS